MRLRRFTGNQGLVAQPWLRRFRYPPPLTLIPEGSGETVIFHVGAKGGAVKTYVGPTWSTGPAGGPTIAAESVLWGKPCEGMYGWSSRKYLKVAAGTFNSDWGADNWVCTFIVSMPTAVGEWSSDPYYFSFGLGYTAGANGLYMGARVFANPYFYSRRAASEQSMGYWSKTPHVVTVAKVDASNYIHKVDNATGGASYHPTQVWGNYGTTNTYIGTYWYNPDTSPGTNTVSNSWASGTVYEAKMVRLDATPTQAYLTALHTAIMS